MERRTQTVFDVSVLSKSAFQDFIVALLRAAVEGALYSAHGMITTRLRDPLCAIALYVRYYVRGCSLLTVKTLQA